MISAAKRILPNSFRKATAYGILEDVPHGILDCVPRSQDVVVVALLPQMGNLELCSSDIFNALLREFTNRRSSDLSVRPWTTRWT